MVRLKLNLPTRQNKEKEKWNIFKSLTGKNLKIVCRNKVLLVLKNFYNLFFTQKFLLSFFRLMSLFSQKMQHFLKDCFTRRILPFSLFSVVNYSQLSSFRPMHTQFRSILLDLKSFDYVKKEFCCLDRSVVGLKFKLLTRQNKDKKKLLTFKNSNQKILQNCVRKKLHWHLKNAQNLFLTPKLLLPFFRLLSLVSHHPAFLQKMFYKKNSALFLVFCGELFPIVFI